ncbi:LacI family DNA-binding transcriptional regulator [Promicromonospora thailandica]|uniref:Transcriptional regulator, LacI family n=1 Tax=Promicromonospora thailandica TaxID=765201 RepID=A0A9X2GE83_9MICO|nr:LacI family DNA-binding transcriptional regulator [Promicromonospora thailandica]MCP2267006.1 transcriptional regulator, LacI family [Promicromonospora thailandica]BFF16716.1 LacI family DNA-binding transcriptional regulator [Promicromonospora thailandica]
MTTTPRRARAPRQSDVARLAGVSQSAVSRVIGGDTDAARIPEATVRRIQEAIKELGYVPNPTARKLRTGRNRLLGVHTFEAVFPRAREDFYLEFLLGIEERAEEIDHDLVLFTSTGGTDGRRRVYRDGVNRLNVADGAVLLGVAADRAELARLEADGYPFVHIGRREVPGTRITCVVPDYESAAAAIVDRLADLGHTRIGYLSAGIDEESYADRRRGYESAVARRGLHDVSPAGPPGPGGAPDPAWLDTVLGGTADRLTAVVADAEWLAHPFAEALAARGLAVPRDVSVAVLEGVAPDAAVRWDCLQIPRREVGRLAIDTLVGLLDEPGTPVADVLVECVVVEGETVTAPAGTQGRTE